MINDDNHKATQIAINFGPVNGNIAQQNIYSSQPTQPMEPAKAEPQDEDSQEPTAEAEPASTAQLSISQAVILFSALLGEPLESGYGQQKTKLADLISRVTGYKSGSVRQKIIEIGKMDVYPHHIQQDAEIVAKIIDTYNAQAASDIRITYLDE